MNEQAWHFHNPTRITFGADCLNGIADLIAGRRYVIVTYDLPFFAAITGRISNLAGKPLLVINNIDTNPDFIKLEQSRRAFRNRAAKTQVIVALGGGSVIDAAKVLAVADGDFPVVRRFLQTTKGGDDLKPLPIIAIPTTSGTGSEVTSWATVWDTQAKVKHSLNLPGLYPEHALVDAQLMKALPRQLTISTGLDALSHALESIWNINANPVSTALAIAAAGTVLKTLPALADDLDNLQLRSDMARAALNAGLAFSNTKTALAHALSYPVTLNHQTPHGIACSFSLPRVMRWIVGADGHCDQALKRIFGDDLMAGADRLDKFLIQLGVGTAPAEHGISPEEWRQIVAAALTGERGSNFLGDADQVLASLA